MGEWVRLATEDMTQADALRVFADHGVSAHMYDEKGLKAAYRRLAVLHHPDRGGDGRTMALINTAYHVLAQRAEMARAANGAASPRTEHRHHPETPPWAWAGYAGGGLTPSAKISKPSYTDLNFVKKRMWELSGGSTEEWNLDSFNGRIFCGAFTVFGSPAIFDEMARATVEGDRYNRVRAVFASRRGDDNRELLLIWSDGLVHEPPIRFEHHSWNGNPANDLDFVRTLPKLLDEIRDTAPA